MRNSFIGYYPLTEPELNKLWSEGLVAVDANVLLNLHRYSLKSSEDFIDILRALSDRLWIPHQAAKEYQANRRGVIYQQANAYTEVKDILATTQDKLISQLGKYRLHPTINLDIILAGYQNVLTEVIGQLDKYEQEYIEKVNDDKIWTDITELFDGKVGTPYTEDQLTQLYKLGTQRYERLQPPGYSDIKKDIPSRYGDLLVWLQLIEKVKQVQKPVIFVTDDRKEDWWYRLHGKTVGPRPELIEEMREKTSALFYMYQADQFFIYASEHLGGKANLSTSNEIANVRTQDERYLELEQTFPLRDLEDSYTLPGFLRLMAGMCKYALTRDGMLPLGRISERLGVTRAVVELGLKWLESRGQISVNEKYADGNIYISSGSGIEEEGIREQIQAKLEGELSDIRKAYREWLAKRNNEQPEVQR